MRYFLLAFIFTTILGSSSAQEVGVVSATYHDITARYNGYFIAKERLAEIEQRVYDAYTWDYTQILPIYPQFDSTMSKSLENEINECVEKASIAIQRHPESRWEDDAYILVGKARMYESSFQDAIETFKYVNTHGDELVDRHKALMELLRVFTEAHEYRNAEAVMDYLEREEIAEENKQLYHHHLAYYYQVRENYPYMIENLVRSEKRMPKGPERARINFVIGQVYQELEQDDSAYYHYKRALRGSKTYELSFFTKLNMSQVSQLAKTENVKKIHRYFRKLLRDQKNIEYQDRIYFEMGNFELKRGNLGKAIEHYKSSLSVQSNNQRQRSYSYLKLGQIYYDSLSNYPMAKAYYDSTIRVLDKEHDDYELSALRQEVLADFVKYFTILNTNDSLIALSKIAPDSLVRIISRELDDKESEFLTAKELAKKAKREQRAASRQTNSYYSEENQVTISGTIEGEWYFYNVAQLSQGYSQFRERWGDRTLEDNWRRGDRVNKQLTETSPTIEKEKPSEEDGSSEEEVFDRESEKSKLLSTIPRNEDDIHELEVEIELAHYELGKIYNLKLIEPINAIYHFEQIVNRFPESQYKPEVLYQLYLLQMDGDSSKSMRAGNTLVEFYPETIYAKLVLNPNYIEDSKRLNLKMKGIYERVYARYSLNEYDTAIFLADSALQDNPQSEYTQYLRLVRAMAKGQKEGVDQFQIELNKFVLENPDSDLAPYAAQLVKSSEDFQSDLFSASRAIYLPQLNEKHFFMLIYRRDSELSERARMLVNNFVSNNKMALDVGTLVLNETFALVRVEEFPGKGSATAFKEMFENAVAVNTEDEFYLLLITLDNFEIFYETKDLETYLTFFEKNYL